MIGALAPLALAAALASSPAGTTSACIECHRKQTEDPELAAPVKALLAEDIHAQRGLSCTDCHGGNAAAAPDDRKAAHDEDRFGFLGAPDPTDIPDLCGRCHSDIERMRRFNPKARVDQLTEYRRSTHGLRNAEGDERVATCASCHGAHGVLAIANPKSPVYPTHVAATCGGCHTDEARMKKYDLNTGQLALWELSVHGRALARGDLSAPTCNDCHGNHGAVPPGVESIANVCGQCHTREAMLFAQSPLKEPWDRLGLAECAKCHGNHEVGKPGDAMVGAETPSVCVRCHEHGRAGLGVAAEVRASYDQLQEEISRAGSLLDRAEQLGMEVSPDRYALSAAQDSLIEARVLVHSFEVAKIRPTVDEGMEVARKVQEAGQEALRQLAIRRRGLAISVVFILATILALWLKIRELERPQRPASGG